MRNGTTMAEVVERLEHANGNYQLTETWKGKGIYALLGRAKRVSAGTLGADGPRPTEYMDERSGRDTQRVFIDWKANTITRRYKGKTSTEPVPADTQDRLSFLLALAFASRNGQPVTFHVVDGRGMSHHTYQPAGREKLATPAGEFDAIKMTRRNEGSGDVRRNLACGQPQLPAGPHRDPREGRHALRARRHAHVAVRVTRALLAHAGGAASMVLRGDAPADQLLSRYFREHRNLGQNDRAFVAETVFAVLRRKRSLEAASGASAPHALVAAALLRVLGHSARSMQGLIDENLLARIRQASTSEWPAAVRADLPDWLWERLAGQYGDEEALRIAHGLLNPAPLDLRVNLARSERDAAQRAARRRRHRVEAHAILAGGRCASPESRRSIVMRFSPRVWLKCRTRAASFSPGCSRRAAAR